MAKRAQQQSFLFDDPPTAETSVAAPTPIPAEPEPIRTAVPLSAARVWAIDAMSLIFQVFHAVPEMTSPGGEPVNAVFGFTRDLLWVLEQKKPDYLFVAYDLPVRIFAMSCSRITKVIATRCPLI